jgi:hypothetical protein
MKTAKMIRITATFFATLFATALFANPPGIVDVGQKLFQFNVIAKPGGWDPQAGNACNGSRIFFAQDNGGNGNTMGTIKWVVDPNVHGFELTDCNGTDGQATVTADETVNFAVFIRVMGPANTNLDLACEMLTTLNTENLCLITTASFKKGNSFSKVMQNIANDEYAEVLWTLSGDWKIFQVRLYELLP